MGLKIKTMKIRFALVFIPFVMMLLSYSMMNNKTKKATKLQPVSEQDIIADTAKIKSDISDFVNSITSGKPDTTKLKHDARDILSTAVNVLSDPGIDKPTGNDQSAKEAGSMVKKIRDATGLTPAALDSMKKTISTLDQ